MSASVHCSALALVALALAPACAGRLEDVIRGQAAGDLGCPEGQVTVSGRSGSADLRSYVVSACGQERSYQAACNSLGTCVAYPVRGRDDAGSREREDLWADPPSGTEAEERALSPSDPLVIPEVGRPESASVPEPEAEPAPVEPPVAVWGEPRAVTLRNECERTVALFIGEDPASGAGRYTSLGSTNTATLRLRTGEPVWLLDPKGAGMTSIAVADGVDEIAVLEGCGGFVAR